MIFGSSALAHLANRRAYRPRWLFYAQPRSFSTDEITPIGLWDGDDTETMTVEGESRTYYGAQSVFGMGAFSFVPGGNAQSHTITVSGLTVAAETLLRDLRTDLAPVQIHLMLTDPASHTTIEIIKMFEGFINKTPIPTPALGSSGGGVEIELLTQAAWLTRTMPLKKTDDSQQQRSGDRGRRYGDGGEDDEWEPA